MKCGILYENELKSCEASYDGYSELHSQSKLCTPVDIGIQKKGGAE